MRQWVAGFEVQPVNSVSDFREVRESYSTTWRRVNEIGNSLRVAKSQYVRGETYLARGCPPVGRSGYGGRSSSPNSSIETCRRNWSWRAT